MKKLVFAMAACLACGSAMADRWAWSAIGGDYTEIQIVNIDTIECEGKVCTGWVASVNSDPKKAYDLVQDFLEIDCKRMQRKILYESTYLRGQQKGSSPAQKEFIPIPPGTVGYETAKMLCKKIEHSVDFTGSPFDLVKPAKKLLKEFKDKDKQ